MLLHREARGIETFPIAVETTSFVHDRRQAYQSALVEVDAAIVLGEQSLSTAAGSVPSLRVLASNNRDSLHIMLCVYPGGLRMSPPGARTVLSQTTLLPALISLSHLFEKQSINRIDGRDKIR